MSFEEFGLSPELLSGLADVRIEKPTPLQQQVIPSALQGKHMLVKHDADDDGVFLIPALHKLTSNGEVSGTRVLILTPSIERAKSIDETVWAMGYHAQISSAALSMKGNREEQTQALQDGAPVVVANPGRLIEILEKNKLKLNDVDLIIIDEAHGMENYSLVSRVKDILKYVDSDFQSLIFSQNNNKATQELSKALLKDAEVIGFDEEAVEEKSEAKEASNSESESESESDSSQNEQQEDSNSTPDEPFELDQEEVNRKLAAASVSVVLNPEENKEEEEDDEEDDEQDSEDQNQDQDQDTDSGDDDSPEDVERKLAEASVSVVLNPEENKEEEEENEDEDTSESDEEDNEPVSVPEDLTQAYIYVPPRAKISTLLAHLEKTLTDKIVVFAASKRTTDRLFRIIRKKGWGVVSINEGLKEEYYEERFAKFTSGEMKILLVGGLAANEVELDEVKQVINYDVPNEVEEYKYRAELVGNGKAARMISLVSKMDKDDIDEIVKKVGYAPTEIPLPEEVKEKKKKKSSNKDKKSDDKGSDNKGSDKKDDRKKKDSSKDSSKDESKKRRKKPSSRKKEDSSSDDRRRRKKPSGKQEKESSHGLPRPTYDGLSGGREGKEGKRPSPSKSDGTFGWIKKLFD